MASNHGELPIMRTFGKDQRVAAGLEKHGLVSDASWLEDGKPQWKLTDDGRTVADRSKHGQPERCFRCDVGMAVYVKFSGAQTAQEVGYPDAHLLCQRCFDEDREQWPDIPVGRVYRMTPVGDAA
jgi:hypothetical protein